jgi:hypothetical protein
MYLSIKSVANPALNGNGLGEVTPQRVARWLRVFIAPGQVTELRALKVRRGRYRPHVEAGFFDFENLEEMAEAALEVTPYAAGVYFIPNPLKPEILARRACRMDWAEDGELAKDKDVLCRRWLLVDIDPVRDALISATRKEKAAAREVAKRVRAELAERGWGQPILGDSGNGYHLLYPVNLPNDDASTQMLERVLLALAQRYSTERVTIDKAVFNAGRLCKVPGTWARKGSDTVDRPHRQAKLLGMDKEIRA